MDVIQLYDYVEHISGVSGKVIQIYQVTGSRLTIKIGTDDKRIFYAPLVEFKKA